MCRSWGDNQVGAVLIEITFDPGGAVSPFFLVEFRSLFDRNGVVVYEGIAI